MKRIILGLFTILSTAALVAGSTRAVFSASDSFVGNTIATAVVHISALSEPMGLWPKPLNASGLVPGAYTNYARGVVFNQSDSTNVKLYMYLDNINGVACPKTNIQVWTGNAAGGADSERGYLLMNSSLASYAGSGNRVQITGYVFNPTIPPNNSAVIQQRAQLDPSATNGYQGTSCTWNEVFVAETP